MYFHIRSVLEYSANCNIIWMWTVVKSFFLQFSFAQRLRRALELIKAEELNDGLVNPIDKKPTQEQYQVKTTMNRLRYVCIYSAFAELTLSTLWTRPLFASIEMNWHSAFITLTELVFVKKYARTRRPRERPSSGNYCLLQRMRRTLELVKAQELNDGEVKPVVNRPTQEQYQVKTTMDLLHFLGVRIHRTLITYVIQYIFQQIAK